MREADEKFFISYKTDPHKAEAFALAAGLAPFLPAFCTARPGDIPPGDAWRRTLEREVGGSVGFILLTDGTELTYWMEFEYDLALNREKIRKQSKQVYPIVSLIFPGAALPSEPVSLGRYHHVQLEQVPSRMSVKDFQNLAEAILGNRAQSALHAPVEPAEPAVVQPVQRSPIVAPSTLEFRWQRVHESIANKTECPLYRRHDVPTDPRLHPLGINSSGLWEFAAVGTGEIPAWNEATKTIQLDSDMAIVMILVPGGTFYMGSNSGDDSEKPVHRVTNSPFYMAKYATTESQWDNLKGNKFGMLSLLPVVNVSWLDVIGVLEASQLNAQRLWKGDRFLPTEAEWEYACRAGTTTEYSFGNGESQLGKYAWFRENSDGARKRASAWPIAPKALSEKNSVGMRHPVGEKLSNPWGFHDMHGNVWEWCADEFATYDSAEARDPRRESGKSDAPRVVRGGSWLHGAGIARSAYRYARLPGYRDDDLGFRLVLRSMDPAGGAGK